MKGVRHAACPRRVSLGSLVIDGENEKPRSPGTGPGPNAARPRAPGRSPGTGPNAALPYANAVTIALGVVVLLIASCTPEARGLVVSPSRIAQAVVSDDVDLCQVTAARVIMDRVDDADGALLDELLVQQPDEPCVWRSASEQLLPRGKYKLLIRFDAVPRADSACGEDASVSIGAYLIPEIDFPFDESFRGIQEQDFLSLVEQSIPAENLDFDPDDDGRDSLAEIAAGGDPCTKNEAPVVTLEQLGGNAADEDTVTLRASSLGASGDVHRLVVAVVHENGAGAGTAQINFSVTTDDGTPTISAPPADEGWLLEPITGDDDASDGAASFDLSLRLDEPFVGAVTVRAFASIDGVTPIATATPLALDVADSEDETVILDDDFQPLDRLEFPEVRSTLEQNSLETDEEFATRVKNDLLNNLAGTVRIRVQDEDLDDDVSVLNARIVAAQCPPITSIARDNDAFALKWGAQNADAVLEATSGAPQTCVLELVDGGGTVKGTATARLFVSPLSNDAPSYLAPGAGALGMPSAPFIEHTAPFIVIDPDQIADAPTCTATLTARAGTTCTASAAFDDVTCAPNGVRAGERWPFALVVTPSANYFSACGAEPSFDVSLSITDVSPDGSDAPLSFSTCSGGSSAGCGATFFMRTTRAVEAAALLFNDSGDRFRDVAPVIDAGTGLGLMRVLESPGSKVIGIVELVGPQAPRVVNVSPPGVASFFEETDPGRRGAADGNGRFITAVRDGSGTQVIVRVDASADPANATYTTLSLQAQCQESFNGTLGAFLADRAGNLYVTCNGDTDSNPPARLVRFAPDGTRTDVSLNGRVTPSGFFEGEHISVVVDPVSDTEWIVWPDDLGFVLIDTASIGGTLVTQRVDFTWPGDGFSDLDAHAYDPARGMYLFLYEADTSGDNFINSDDNDDATLSAIVFDGSPALAPSSIDLPEASANDFNGFSFARLMVRPLDAARPVGDADLLVQPGFGNYPRIDLDSFTVVSFLDVAEEPSFSPGTYSSPDARFTVAPSGCDGPDFGVGLALFPWDESATQFVGFSTDCATSENPDAFAVSEAANLAAFIDGNGDLWVFDFVDARAGLDL